MNAYQLMMVRDMELEQSCYHLQKDCNNIMNNDVMKDFGQLHLLVEHACLLNKSMIKCSDDIVMLKNKRFEKDLVDKEGVDNELQKKRIELVEIENEQKLNKDKIDAIIASCTEFQSNNDTLHKLHKQLVLVRDEIQSG
jgi:hypothetical protein